MDAKIDKILGLLGSDEDGEVLAAVRRIKLSLKRQGLSFHQMSLVDRANTAAAAERYENEMLQRQLHTTQQELTETRLLVIELMGELRSANTASADSVNMIYRDNGFEDMPQQVSWHDFKEKAKDVVGGGLGWKGRIIRRLDISRQCLKDYQNGAEIPQSMIVRLWSM